MFLDQMRKAIDVAKKVIDEFLKIYDQLYEIITSIPPTKLDAEHMHFFMTPRSFVQVPGKIVNPLSNANLNDSVSDVLMLDKITPVIQRIFPPLTEVDYILPPAAFKIRKIFSDENAVAMQKLADTLSQFLKGPSEPLPEYKDLKIYNLQFLLFLISSWGPTGRRHFAMPFYP